MSADQSLACSFCGSATPHSALAAFGARCKPCFDAYCLEQPKRPANPQGRQAAFVPRRPIGWIAEAEDIDLPPDVPLPARHAPIPEIAPAPRAASNEEPPAWATEGAE